MENEDKPKGIYEALEIRGGSIFLDGEEIKNMTNFEMEADAESHTTKIIITKYVVLK